MKPLPNKRWLPTTILLGYCIFAPLAVPHTDLEPIPFELSRNHIFVRVLVNGTGPYLFLLDTGAGGVLIAPNILSGIRIMEGDEGAVIGVGEGASQAVVVKNIHLQSGDLQFSPTTVFAIPLDTISSGEGREVDGVMGYDFFSDHVVEIDYQRRLLRLFRPSQTLPPNALQLTFIDKLPIIDAVVTDQQNISVRCKLEIDTGAARPLLLTSSFSALHPGFQFSRSSIRVPLIGAIGQRSMQRITRIAKLTIGPYEFEGPVTGISESQSGLSAQPGIDGMIGGELLARFRLVIDYVHSWIIFEPERDLRSRFDYDMSGLILFTEGPRLSVLTVRYILPSSPAAEAGLRVGDIILSVDGKAASQLQKATIEMMFSKAGRNHDLVVERNGSKIKAKLKPRPLV